MGSILSTLKKGVSGTGFLFGFGFFLAAWKWYDVALYGFFREDLSTFIFRLGFSVGLLLAAIIARFVFTRKTTLLASKKYSYSVLGSLCVLSLVTAFIYSGLWPISQNPTSLIGVIQGFAIGGGVLLWVERFGNVSVIKAIAGLTIAYLVCLIVLFYLLNMTQLFTGITIFMLPLISFGLLNVCRTNARERSEKEPSFSPMKASNSVEMLMWVILVTAIYSLAMRYGADNSVALEVFQIGSLLPVIFIIAFLFFFPGKVGFESMYRMSLILISVGLLIFLFSMQGTFIGQILVGSGYFVVSITMIIVAASYANLSKTSAAQSYLLVIISNGIGSLIGTLVPVAFTLLGLPLYSEVTIILMLVIILILLLLPSTFRKNSNLYTHLSTVDSALESDAQGVSEAALYETIGEEYQLTKREVSILHMHAKGLSQAEIAEAMFIAEGTVRAHYGNIYRKLSVHSKDELSEMLVNYREQHKAI